MFSAAIKELQISYIKNSLNHPIPRLNKVNDKSILEVQL